MLQSSTNNSTSIIRDSHLGSRQNALLNPNQFKKSNDASSITDGKPIYQPKPDIQDPIKPIVKKPILSRIAATLDNIFISRFYNILNSTIVLGVGIMPKAICIGIVHLSTGIIKIINRFGASQIETPPKFIGTICKVIRYLMTTLLAIGLLALIPYIFMTIFLISLLSMPFEIIRAVVSEKPPLGSTFDAAEEKLQQINKNLLLQLNGKSVD